MNIHKGRIALLVCLLSATLQAGCSPELDADGRNVFRPGERWLLTYRGELAERGVMISEEWSIGLDGEHEFIERQEFPYDRRTWDLIELPVAVRAARGEGNVEVLMTIQRRASGSYDDDGAPAITQDVALLGEDYADQLSQMALSVTLDRNGRIVALDPQGEIFAELRSGFEEYKNEAENSSEWDGMFATKQEAMAYFQQQYDASVRSQSMGACSALEAVAPYLPTEDVVAGDTWSVHRENVFPDQAYAFLMVTYGGIYSERATCTVERVEETTEGRLATVEIMGRRVPGLLDIPGASDEEEMELRVDFLELAGELVFNLDTREIVTLRIATAPHFASQEDPDLDIHFVDTISLQRLD